LLAALLFVDFTDEWCTLLLPAATPAIRTELGLSYAEAGALLGLLFGGGLVGGVTIAAADFVSRRLLAGIGAVVYGLCMLTFGLSDTFVVLAIAAFVWGAASDAFVHGASLALADFAGDDLEPTLATVNFVGAFGSLLAPLALAVTFAAGLGWRPPFVAGGLLAVAYGFVLGALPLPGPTGDGDDHTPGRVVRAVLSDPRVWRLGLVELVSESLDLGFLGFLAVYLGQERGFSDAMASAMLAVVLTGVIVGFASVAIGGFRPGLGALKVSAAIEAVAILGMLRLPGVVGVAAAALALGVVAAVWWVAFQAAVLRIRPTQSGTTWAVVGYLGLPAVLAAPAAGLLADRFGLAAAMALFPVLAVLGVLAAPGRMPLPRLPRWATRS
jgi:predicted MFS family arabinose efflux permease